MTRRTRSPLVRAALAVLTLLAFTGSAVADVDVTLEMGHGDRWVIGAATPVVLILENSGDEGVEVFVRLQQATMFSDAEFQHERRVFLNPGGTRRELFVVPGPHQIGASVALDLATSPSVTIHAGTEVATSGIMQHTVRSETSGDARAVRYDEQVIGVVGDPRSQLVSRLPLGFDPGAFSGSSQTPFTVSAMHVNPEVLSIAPLALDGLDSLVVCNPDGAFAADPAVAEALLDWVSYGGHLVISLGTNAGPFGTSPLARELPATWLTAGRRNYDPLFEALAIGWDETLDQRKLTGASGPYVSLSPSTADTGTSDGRPVHFGAAETLRLTRNLGLGYISVLPFDARDFAGAAGTPEDIYRLSRLLQIDAPPLPGPQDTEPTYHGDHIATSMSNAVQQGAFTPPPLPCIMFGLLAYVLLVGPVDWFVLKRLRKERLTTLTFGVTVIGFTVLAYGATMILFSGGASVNRVTFVDIVDGGRGGRQLIRVHDIAGFYEPTGATRDIAFEQPAAVLESGLPGLSAGSQIGSTNAVVIKGAGPTSPEIELDVAIRSQRVIRSVQAGPYGRDLEVTWEDGKPLVANGLPVDLHSVYVMTRTQTWNLGEIKAGIESQVDAARPEHGRPTGGTPELDREASSGQIGAFLAHLSMTRELQGPLWDSVKINVDPMRLSRLRLLRKAGLDRSYRLAAGERALLLAFTTSSPVPLPGADSPGSRYIVIRKEVELP